MKIALKTLSQLNDLKGKKVVLRIDADVDIEDGHIIDDTRLTSSLKTLHFILGKGGKVVLIGHLGRPVGINSKLSLKAIANWFENKFDGKLKETNYGIFSGWNITDDITLLENIRFFKGEEENDSNFSKELGLLGDLYVNEAFAVSHRNHASIVGITKYLSSFAGFHLEKEIHELSKIIGNPKRPLVVLIGGAKIETKLPMVEKMHKIADYVLVGGEIAEHDKVLIKVQHENIKGRKSVVLVADVMGSGKTITPKSVENFIQIINLARTIVWNGPVGEIGKDPQNEESTKQLAEAIVKTDAYKIVGGGDTLAYLRRLGLLSKFDFVSTGGGAMLELLSGKDLPGIKPLMY